MAARAMVLVGSLMMALAVGGAGEPVTASGSPPRSERTPVELVDTAAKPGGHVAVVVDYRGITTAVWAEQSPSVDGNAAFTIRTSRRSRDGRWTTPRTIGCPPADACARTRPDVGVDGVGRVTVVWSEGSRLKTAKRPHRGRWGEPHVLAQEPRDIRPAEVDLAVAHDGAAVVAWSSGDERFPVRVTLRAANAPWRAPMSLDRGYDPDVAISDTGVVLVAQDDGSADLSVRSHSPGAGWGRQHWLGRWPSYDPHVSFGADGRALAVWSHTLGEAGPSRVNGRERSPLGQWTPGFRISPTTSASDDDVAGGVVIGSQGRETVSLVRTAVDGRSTGLVLSRPVGGRWAVQATMPRLAGQAVDLIGNRHDDLALGFRDRVSLHHPGSRWRTTPGGGTIGIMPNGGAIRMWWDGRRLEAQKVSPR